MTRAQDLKAKELSATAPEHAGLWLWRAQRQYFSAMRRRLAERGYDDMTPAHSLLLPHIDLTGSRVQEIAERARLSKQAVSQSVKELCKLDYLEIVADPSDGRAKLVRFTKRGLGFIEEGRAVKSRLHTELVEVIGEASMRKLLRQLRQIAERFDEEQADE